MKRIYVLYSGYYKCGVEARSFYYENASKNLYLRYAIFPVGDTYAVVSSNMPKDKIYKSLEKDEDTGIWINHRKEFEVLQQYWFDCDKGFEMENCQVSKDNKNWYDYKTGSDKQIDALFNEHFYDNDREYLSLWSEYDYELIIHPYSYSAEDLGLLDITDVYDADEFSIEDDFDTDEMKVSKEYFERIAEKK